jgi:hypothetical protein
LFEIFSCYFGTVDRYEALVASYTYDNDSSGLVEDDKSLERLSDWASYKGLYCKGLVSHG